VISVISTQVLANVDIWNMFTFFDWQTAGW